MIDVVHSPEGLVTSKNPIIFEFHDDDGTQPNHRFVIAATISHPSRSVTVYLLEFPILSNATADLSSLVDAFLNELDYILPDLSLTFSTWQDVSDAVLCDLALSLHTAYGFPLVDVEDTITLPPSGGAATYRCLRGGFSYPNWPERKYIIDWLLQAGNNAPFLTWKPKVTYISPNQPEFLTFIYSVIGVDAYHALNLHVDIKYTDGTTGTYSGTNFNAYGLHAYQIAVGIDQLSLTSAEPTKTILYYKAYIKFATVKVSEERTYYVDYHKHQAERFVLFANSLGGWDTVRCVGTGEFQGDYVRSNAEISQGKYSNAHGTRKAIENEEQAGRKINTGFIARTDVQWLRDLFLSTDVQTIENGKLVPISIVSKKFSMQEESSLNALTLEYDYRFTNTVYTPNYQPVTYAP